MRDALHRVEQNMAVGGPSIRPGRKAVGSKWVYKIKHNTDEQVARFRARLVAQGYGQQYGTDYDQVFAPVVLRQTTSRTPLAVAAKQGMTMRQFYVKTAVLY